MTDVIVLNTLSPLVYTFGGFFVGKPLHYLSFLCIF
ncbi:MAG: hypothetical protein VE98_C0001G0329 [candidate division Kazan bacterium GW2011_GWA1_50_15]|uniref:Uncharacterized protein n=1 Tax=candidate division Kazan bacterium GW2011_GWA1_50_15 TaxID=1620412 RepID=A0A0G4BA97_UNCK3|nr:MAG: hypothetical protein VE98_C0001G0329 [candidate division Kazan bacterium GW2011_GWA1_50_15]